MVLDAVGRIAFRAGRAPCQKRGTEGVGDRQSAASPLPPMTVAASAVAAETNVII